MNPTENAWLTIAAAAIPEVANFVTALLALRKKYPQLTDAQIQATVATITTSTDSAADAGLAKILADQAAHPSA
jgi:hypothetical protein